MSAFWALYSHHRFQSAAADASAARSEARGARMDAREVNDQLDRTLMACEAMWSILRDKLGVTDEELMARVNELDLSDGKLDGRIRRTSVVQCSNCQRTVSTRFVRCTYCGQEMDRAVFS